MNLNDFIYNDTKSMVLKLIVFIVIFLVITDQIFSLTKFVYNYNKHYDYGQMLNTTCNTNYTEYETQRYQLCQNNMKIKIQNDNLNDRYYIIFFIMSLILTFFVNYFFMFIYVQSVFENAVGMFSKIFTTTTASSGLLIPSLILNVSKFFTEELNELITTNKTLNAIFVFVMISIKIIGLLYLLFMIPLSIIVKLIGNVNISPFSNNTANIIPHTIILIIIVFIGLIQKQIYISYFTYILFFILYIVLYEYIMVLTDIYMNRKNINIYENSTNEELKNLTFSQCYYGNIDGTDRTEGTDNAILELLSNTFGINKMKIANLNILLSSSPISKFILGLFALNTKTGGNNDKKDENFNYNPFTMDNFNVMLFLYMIGAIILFVIYILLKQKPDGFSLHKIFDLGNSDSNILFSFGFMPILIIFIILFMILITKEYNTMINKYIIYEPCSSYKKNIYKINNIFNEILDNDKSSVSNDSVCKNIANGIHLVLYTNLFKYYEKSKLFVPRLSYVGICSIDDFIDYRIAEEYDFRLYTKELFYSDTKCTSIDNNLLLAIMKSIIPEYKNELSTIDYESYKASIEKQLKYALFNILNKKTYDGKRKIEISNRFEMNNTIISPDILDKNILDYDNILSQYNNIITEITDKYIEYIKIIHPYTIKVIQGLCKCNNIEDFTTHGYKVIMEKIDNTINNDTSGTYSINIKKDYIEKYNRITGQLFDNINTILTLRIKNSKSNYKLAKYIIQNYNIYETNESYKYKKNKFEIIDTKSKNELTEAYKFTDIEDIKMIIDTQYSNVEILAKLFINDIDNIDYEETDYLKNSDKIIETTFNIELLIQQLQENKKNYMDLFKTTYYFDNNYNKQLVYDYKIQFIDSMIDLHDNVCKDIRTNNNIFQTYDVNINVSGFTDINTNAVKKENIIQKFNYDEYKKQYQNNMTTYNNQYESLYKLANNIYKLESNILKYKDLEETEITAKKLLNKANDTSNAVYVLFIIYIIIIIIANYVE